MVHLVANHLSDMSTDLAGIGPLRHGRDDEFHLGGYPNARGLPPKGLRTRDVYIPALYIDSIKVKTRDFR